MTDSSGKNQQVDESQLLELVKLFEGFSEASTTFAQSYHALEQRIARLSRQLEEQSRLLERTEGFLSSVLAHVPVGIIVLDMDGNISLFNEEAERLSGFNATDVVGKPYGNAFAVDVNSPTSAIFTLTNGAIIDTSEKELAHSEGSSTPVRFATNWIFGDDGRPMGVLEVLEDMRQIRELQERMQHRASLAALGEMAAQVAHELRNPLAGVQGFAQFLQEDFDEDHPSRPTVDKIVAGVRDIEHLAGRLLEFTRPMSPSIHSVNLAALLADEVELAKADASKNHPDLTIDLTLPEEQVEVQCDGSLIKQVILNLLKNSMIAIDGKGRIEVSMRWDLLRNRVEITVVDDGCGIKEEHLNKIYHPFFTTRTKGTGLGLSMVKKIVDAHQGVIEVTSREGEGSQFTLELPIVRGA